MFDIGARIFDSKHGRAGKIEACEYKPANMDYMYTIAYDNGQWGKYYGKHMSERFAPVIDSQLITGIDFQNKERIS